MDTPREELDQVERRLVGPVDVFDDHNGWQRTRRQFIQDRGKAE